MDITFQPIGQILSPFSDIKGMPIQPAGALGIKGKLEVFPQFQDGLKDLEGFSHVFLLYHLHKIEDYALSVVPFLDKEPRGIFATRAPKRPNPIGLSIVELISIANSILHVKNIDVLNGTPLLDIKPYLPEFDHHPVTRMGWYEKFIGQVKTKKSDDRFR